MTRPSAQAWAMTEDELLEGITDALTLGRWLWTHTRRSDLGELMGTPGVPDLIAVHPDRHDLVALELKRQGADPTPDQSRWLAALAAARSPRAALVYPDAYERLYAELIGERLIGRGR